jgi:hypothetical protein
MSSPTKQYNRYQLKMNKSKKYNNNDDKDDDDDDKNDNKKNNDNYNRQPQQSTINHCKQQEKLKGYSDIAKIRKN